MYVWWYLIYILCCSVIDSWNVQSCVLFFSLCSLVCTEKKKLNLIDILKNILDWLWFDCFDYYFKHLSKFVNFLLTILFLYYSSSGWISPSSAPDRSIRVLPTTRYLPSSIFIAGYRPGLFWIIFFACGVIWGRDGRGPPATRAWQF